MLKIIKDEYLTWLVNINEGCITQLAATSKASTIDILSINKVKAIKEVNSNNNKVDYIDVINRNSIGYKDQIG